MNPTAIFSKSGKGVQEASGKTSQLSRGDRAVLSAIDGRATLADVAGKVGKQFDNDFKGLITKLDKDGFIREVSPGAAVPGGGAKPAAGGAKPAAPSKPTAPMDMASDLDFTAAMAVPKKAGPAAPPPQAVSRAPAPPPKPTVAVPPKPPPPSAAEQAKQAQIAKDQQSAFAKAREEAERKQQEERDRLKAEAEAKVRAETETKLRAEAEQKAKDEADAKAKKAEADAAAARAAAVRAAAEAKMKAEAEAKRAKEEAERAKREAEEKAERARQEAERARKEAEAEAKRAREEAERAKREAEEKAERARKEAEEKARREQEELKRKLEEERRAREEAERKAKEEAERVRRELEEERRKMEAERKAREEETRREEAERAARRKREEEEEQERRAQREAQEESERTARRKQREEEEERERAEKEAARKRESEPSLESLMAAQSAPAAAPPPAPKKEKAATGDAFADSLLADLDSFTQRDDEDRKAKEEADRKAKEEAARRQQEEADRQAREAAEARQREEDERRRKEEEAQRIREEEERRVRKVQEEQEQAEREADERRRKIAAASGAAAGAAGAASDDIGITDDDLQLDEVKKEAALLEKKKNRKEEREKEREKERAQKKEREREAKSRKEKEREEKEAKKAAAAYSPRRRKSNFGRNAFLTLILLAVIGAGVVHVMPLSTAEYEAAATEAVGRPVKIGSGRFSAIGGLQFKFDNVSVGGIAITTVRAFPEIGSLIGERKEFSRIELDGMTLPQDALGEALFAKTKGDSLRVERVVAKNLKLAGALPLPVLEADAQLQGGAVRTVTLRGGEGLVAKLAMKDSSIDFDVNTSQFTLPFAPGITLVQFGMKGEATRSGMKIAQWDGLLYSGHVTGTANVRWGNTWNIDGVMTARGVNAAVFAPALLSNGRGEGTGRFTMSGVEPAKLGASGRLEGNFTVTKGVLGSFDLSRALQTNGRQVTGQTQFAEMSGQGVYDRGAVSLRNINLGAGALNAGASADIAEGGALSGRIVADVKTSTQNVRATLILGGTVTEPSVRN